MKRTISFVLILSLGLTAEVANADFTFGESMNLGPVINSGAVEFNPRLTGDGLEFYFMSQPALGMQGDIWYTTRAATSDPWRGRQPASLPTDETEDYAAPDITEDGLTLYVSSWRRLDRYGAGDIYVATRSMRSEPWSEPTNLGPVVNTSYSESCSFLSADGLSLYFCGDPWTTASPQQQRPGGNGMSDIWIANRATQEDQWGPAQNLGPVVNSSNTDAAPCITTDDLLLFFHSNRPGGYGGTDLWMARRHTRDSEWGTPMNLGPTVNSPSDDYGPEISPDGSMLFFSSIRTGGFGSADIYQVPIIPIIDFNGDGIVDCADMCEMVDHWGTNEQLYDIGPMPWGDGIVDVQDLIVLAEYLSPVEPEEVNVDEEDYGSQVELEQGRILVVTLKSNPTTGYGWEVAEIQESILEQMGEAEFKQSETVGPPLVGAGGWEIFRFKAISAGQMTLQLIYHRPWEEGVEPLKTFSIQVVVN